MIEVLRFVAAFMVVVAHSAFYTHERLTQNSPNYEEGANGVRLFFVISGFVMIVSSKRLIDLSVGWRIFAMKRICRIVPMYWAILTLKLAIMLATPAAILHANLDWLIILKSYLFIPARNVDGLILPFLGVGWTLNFEMFFYALFCVSLFLRISPVMFMAPILALLSALFLIRSSSWPTALYFYCDPITLDFLAGMLIASWVRELRTVPPLRGLALALAGLLYLFAPLHLSSNGFPAFGLAISLSRTIASAFVIIGVIPLEKRWGARIPRFVLLMGTISYSLYLIHPIVAPAVPQLLAKLRIVQPLLAIAGSMAVSVLAATVVYRLLETPLSNAATQVVRTLGFLSPGGSQPGGPSNPPETRPT
jgi:peptidoglycan/LPS O-acetylase OafA/YrhL